LCNNKGKSQANTLKEFKEKNYHVLRIYHDHNQIKQYYMFIPIKQNNNTIAKAECINHVQLKLLRPKAHFYSHFPQN
jgi:uncharacterized membrane protein